MGYKVIKTDDCINLEDVALAEFKTLEEAEQFRPDNMNEIKSEGYKWLEIDNFTIGQRVNTVLTGECVGFLS